VIAGSFGKWVRHGASSNLLHYTISNHLSNGAD
jgi:hypothetical protein